MPREGVGPFSARYFIIPRIPLMMVLTVPLSTVIAVHKVFHRLTMETVPFNNPIKVHWLTHVTLILWNQRVGRSSLIVMGLIMC